MHVRDLDDRDALAWDRYVDAHDGGTLFHRSGWARIFREALGHRTHYLLAEQDGAMCGLLPLVHINSRLFGSSLSSLAFSAHAGPLASSAEAVAALYDAALARGRELGVAAVEYRLPAASGRERPTKDLYANFTKPLHADADANMQAIRSKQRNVIRKAVKLGLQCEPATVDAFYGVYAESVRNLGTPVFPRRLFHAIAQVFPDAVEVIGAAHEGRAVAAAMNLYYRETVCPYYWGGTRDARQVNGNDFLAWSIMGLATARGCTRFDFGRSKRDTGPWQWKLNLGFEPSPLYYEYDPVRATSMPDVNPLNPKYRLFIECWKKLPLPLANTIGPWLARSLG